MGSSDVPVKRLQRGELIFTHLDILRYSSGF